MRSQISILKTLAASAALTLSSSAGAATLCVNPDKPASCSPTIQSAILDADPGDKIKIASGTYFENVMIPNGKDGLQIEGKRSAILDAGDDGEAGPNTGIAIVVDSDEVRLKGFTIRGGASAHIGMTAGSSGLRLKDLRSQSPGANFLRADGPNPNVRVEDCEISSTGAAAIVVVGNDAVLEDNELRGAINGGFWVAGDRSILEKNKIYNVVGDDSIHLEGDDVEVVRNTIIGTDGIGIFVEGPMPFVSKNKVENGGIEVTGEGLVVQKNEIVGAFSSQQALAALCLADCEDAAVSKNQIRSTRANTGGIIVTGTGPGMRVSKNDLRDISGFGIASTADMGADLVENRLRAIGSSVSTPCIYVEGHTHLVEENEITDCSGDGYTAGDGIQNQLVDNRVTRSGRNGYRAASAAATTLLEDNRSKNATVAAYLVEDGSASASLEDNDSSVARFDLCNEGVNTNFDEDDFDLIVEFPSNAFEECPSY